MVEMTDVLPAPFGPMMPHRSPSATVKVTFLKSSVAPKETPMLESERRVTERRAGQADMGAECCAVCWRWLPPTQSRRDVREDRFNHVRIVFDAERIVHSQQ